MAAAPLTKDVLILGAGPAALAALHSFRHSKILRPTAFDPRPTASGLWHYDELPSSKKEEEISPLYTNLDTNIPHSVMKYTTHDWPKGCELFPERTEVEKYLVSYSQDVIEYIKFGEKILNIKKKGEKWSVIIEDRATYDREEELFDNIVMAGGNYAFPRVIPRYPGMNDWLASGGKSLHSKFYRSPDEYSGQTVLIVGAGASGIDISRQIATKAKKVFWSVRGNVESDGNIEVVPEIKEFSGGKSITFSDDSIKENIDAIVWCIGYYFERPELVVDVPVESLDGSRMRNLYEHIFYVHDTSLAFLGLPQKVIPFVITQAQAAVVRRVWEGRIELPNVEEMQKWENERVSRTGEHKFHQMSNLEDADYIDRLGKWCDEASGDEPEPGEVPRWGKKDRWIRTLIPKIKRKYEDEKAKGKHIQTIEELGFVYEEESPLRENLERMETEKHFKNSSG